VPPLIGAKLCRADACGDRNFVIYAIKLLIPVLAICALAWLFLRGAFQPLLEKREYNRAWAIIVAATLVVFLAHSLPLYGIGIAIVAFVAQAYLGGGVRGKLAAFMLLMVVLPPLSWQVGDIGDISYLLGLTGARILALVLLTGPALQLMGDRRFKREGWVVPLDLAVIAYQVLKIALMAPHSTGTTLLRMLVESVLDILLPYYVASRAIRTETDLRFLLSHLVLGLAFTAAVGVAEFFANRYFYSELQFVYNYKWTLTLGLWTFLRGPDWRRWQVAGVYALLIGCLVFTFSRGPWIGAIIFGLSLLGLRRLNTKAFTALFVLLLGSAVVMKISGADQFAINALSAVFGSSEADLSSINYRNELLDMALALLRQSPWLGVPDYASQMLALRQGEGIIDLVNSYIAIALDAGVIGLVIYLLPYVLAFRRMLRVPGISRRQSSDGTAGWFTAIFVAMTIALLVTIFTTSMFFTMPILLILLLALPIARLAMKTETLDLPLDIEPPRGYGIDGRPLIIR